MYFGTLRMHQIAPFLSFFFSEEHGPAPKRVLIHILTGLPTTLVYISLSLFLSLSLSLSLSLWLISWFLFTNFYIKHVWKGPNCIYKKNLSMVSKNKCLRIVWFFSSFKLFEKTVALPTRKTNGLTLIIKKWNLESIPPYLLYQEQQQNFKNGLILWPIYHVFHSNNYMPCIPWLSPVFTCTCMTQNTRWTLSHALM